MVSGLEVMEGVTVERPKGALYCIAALPVENAAAFAKWLLEEVQLDNETVMVALSAGFYSTPNTGLNQVRLAYVLKKEDLKRALVLLKEDLKVYNK